MRCYCCNVILSTQEATRRFKESKTFVDMCDKCRLSIDDQIEVTNGNTDDKEEDYSEDWDDR